MPRSQPNVDRGNFMVSLHMLDLDTSPLLEAAARQFVDNHDQFEGHNILFSSRRSALVTYVDPLVSLASRILFLFYYMIFPSSQTTDLTVDLAERVSFPRGSALPASAYIEIEAGQTIETYRASLVLTAQLRGLRWLMYHYRLPTYIFFTGLFWICEVLFMAGAWSFWTIVTGFKNKDSGHDDGETKSNSRALENPGGYNDDLSDRSQRFPTTGESLRLKQDPDVKDEGEDDEKEEAQRAKLLSEIPIAGAEADDEYEDDERGGRAIAGTGSSYSEQRRGSGARARRRTSHHETM
jgi:seipin